MLVYVIESSNNVSISAMTMKALTNCNLADILFLVHSMNQHFFRMMSLVKDIGPKSIEI